MGVNMNNIQLAVFSSWVLEICSRMQFSLLPVNQDKDYDVLISKLRSFIETVCMKNKILRADEMVRSLLQYPFIWYDMDFKFFLCPDVKKTIDIESVRDIEYLSMIQCDAVDFNLNNADGLIQVFSVEKKCEYKNWFTVLRSIVLVCSMYNLHYIRHRSSSSCSIKLGREFWILLRKLTHKSVGLDTIKEFLNWLYNSDNSAWYWGLSNSTEYDFDATNVLQSLETLLIEIGDLKKRFIFKRSNDPIKPAQVDLNSGIEAVERIAPIDDSARLVVDKLDSVIGSADNYKPKSDSQLSSRSQNDSDIIVRGGFNKSVRRGSHVRGAMEYAISGSSRGGNIDTLRDLGVLSRHEFLDRKSDSAVLFRSRLGRTWYYNKE